MSNRKRGSIELLNAIKNYDYLTVSEILAAYTSDKINSIYGPLKISALQIATSLPNESEALPMVQLLLSHGASTSNRDYLGRTALHIAATRGYAQVAQLLIENGVHVNEKMEIADPDTLSYKHGTSEEEMELIRQLPPLSTLGRTALHEAVFWNQRNVVKVMLDNGANPNCVDVHGVTPLLLAGAVVHSKYPNSLREYEKIAELLIKSGADVNAVNDITGSTALHNAASLQSLTVTKLLLEHKATMSTSERCDQTPLHEAAGKGNFEILSLLLEQSVQDVNRPDKAGRTPLHKAAFAGSGKCIKLLLRNGGDLSIKTNSKISVSDLIFKYVPRPMHLLKSVFDGTITCNNTSVNSIDFKLHLDFNVLAPNECDKQMATISSFMDLTGAQELMKHPLIETYLILKWHKIRIFFLILVLIFFVYVMSLSTYILGVIHDEYEWFTPIRQTSRAVLLITATFLAFHSVIQCLLVPRHYIYQYEMWLNLICTIMSFTVCIFGERQRKRQNELNDHSNWLLHIMSIVILLAWSQLMLLIGRFPKYGYYALMFSAVLQNVVKVLGTFVCLVIGFALSFSVQFHNLEHFSDPWRSVVKTAVMMMGEYEYGTLFEKRNASQNDTILNMSRLPGTSRIIFTFFIIIASIVLMNLMIGLAVNDIQELQNAGHVERLKKQATFLSHLETLFLHKFFLSKYFPATFRKSLYHKQKISTDFTIYPGKFGGKGSWKKLFPITLMDTLITIALENRKKNNSVTETDSNLTSLILSLKEEILELKNIVKNLNNAQ